MSESNPFDISDEEVAEHEATLKQIAEYGDLHYRQACRLATEMGDFLKEFDENQPDPDEVKEAIKEWHEQLSAILNLM